MTRARASRAQRATRHRRRCCATIARAGVARERASRPGARDTPRPSSRCAVARPVSRDSRPPPRAPRGCRDLDAASDRPFSPASLAALARPDPRVRALHPRPRHFFGGGASDGAVPSDPAAQARASARPQPRLSRDGGRSSTSPAKSPPPRRTSRSTSRHSSASTDSTSPRSSAPSSAAPARATARVVGGRRRKRICARRSSDRRRRDLGRLRPRHGLLPHLHPTARTHV